MIFLPPNFLPPLIVCTIPVYKRLLSIFSYPVVHSASNTESSNVFISILKLVDTSVTELILINIVSLPILYSQGEYEIEYIPLIPDKSE